jgi:hypothetical protein
MDRGRARRNDQPAQWHYGRPSTIGPSSPGASLTAIPRPRAAAGGEFNAVQRRRASGRWRVYRPSRGPVPQAGGEFIGRPEALFLNSRGATAHGKPGPKSSKARETHAACPRPRGVHAVFHRVGWNLLRAGILVWASDHAHAVRMPTRCHRLRDDLADGEDELQIGKQDRPIAFVMLRIKVMAVSSG